MQLTRERGAVRLSAVLLVIIAQGCASPYRCGAVYRCRCSAELCTNDAGIDGGCAAMREVETRCHPLGVNAAAECVAAAAAAVDAGAHACGVECEASLRAGSPGVVRYVPPSGAEVLASDDRSCAEPLRSAP